MLGHSCHRALLLLLLAASLPLLLLPLLLLLLGVLILVLVLALVFVIVLRFIDFVGSSSSLRSSSSSLLSVGRRGCARIVHVPPPSRARARAHRAARDHHHYRPLNLTLGLTRDMTTNDAARPLALAPCVSFGSLIIDDIRFADGTERHACLGGAGIYASIGMRYWSHTPVAYVGRIGMIEEPPQPSSSPREPPPRRLRAGAAPDTHLLQRLADELLLDVTGTVVVTPPPSDRTATSDNDSTTDSSTSDYLTPRAWNIFSANGHRDFEWSTSYAAYSRLFAVRAEFLADFPAAYKQLHGVHICCNHTRITELLDAIRTHMPQCRAVLWEPSPPSCIAELAPLYERVLPHIELFSPNEEEAISLLGGSTPATSSSSPVDDDAVHVCVQLRRRFGARTIVLRLGARGALVFTVDGELLHVPAYATHVVDVTGAGNAHTGAFVAGWVGNDEGGSGDGDVASNDGSNDAATTIERTLRSLIDHELAAAQRDTPELASIRFSATRKRALQAALQAAVSASFVVEQVGVPPIHQHRPPACAIDRYRALLAHVVREWTKRPQVANVRVSEPSSSTSSSSSPLLCGADVLIAPMPAS